MACEVDPKLLDRWVEVFFDKEKAGGHQAARRWFFEFIPDECKGYVMAKIRQRRPAE